MKLVKKRDIRTKDVLGFMADGRKIYRAEVTVRMTADDICTSISFQAGNTLIQVPLESVSDIIQIVPKKEEKEGE